MRNSRLNDCHESSDSFEIDTFYYIRSDNGRVLEVCKNDDNVEDILLFKAIKMPPHERQLWKKTDTNRLVTMKSFRNSDEPSAWLVLDCEKGNVRIAQHDENRWLNQRWLTSTSGALECGIANLHISEEEHLNHSPILINPGEIGSFGKLVSVSAETVDRIFVTGRQENCSYVITLRQSSSERKTVMCKSNGKVAVNIPTVVISVINRQRFELEEIVLVKMKGIDLEFSSMRLDDDAFTISLNVNRINFYNQIEAAIDHHVFLSMDTTDRSVVALHLTLGRISAVSFRSILIRFGTQIRVAIDELLVWKIVQMVLHCAEYDESVSAETNCTKQLLFYIGRLESSAVKVELSLSRCKSLLPADIRQLKSRLMGNIPIMPFDKSCFTFEALRQEHVLSTGVGIKKIVLFDYLLKELRAQILFLLGRLDFIGSPITLLNDMSSGLKGFLTSGDPSRLVCAVAHGFADSASKVVKSVSDGLVQLSADFEYQHERNLIQNEYSGFTGGTLSLVAGIMSGVWATVQKPYEGAKSAGVSGFISGMGQGVLNSVSLPLAGMLDLAHGVASTLKEHTSLPSLNSSNRMSGRRVPPRICAGMFQLTSLEQSSWKSSKRADNSLYRQNERLVCAFDETDLVQWDRTSNRLLLLTNKYLRTVDPRYGIALPVSQFKLDSLSKAILTTPKTIELVFNENKKCSGATSIITFRSANVARAFHRTILNAFEMYAADYACDLAVAQSVQKNELN